jgi:cytoskeleton protein RodZ
MTQSLGQKLRAAREARGLSVSEVAEQTRIAPMYIESIERDDYKPLPGGIFNKGFVRSFARCVGYDEQEALAEYRKIEEQFKPADEELLRKYKPEVLTDDRAAQSSLPNILFAILIIALLSGGIIFLVNYLQVSKESPQIANAPTPSNIRSEEPAPLNSNPAPTMQNAKFEFRSESEPISLSATADGRTSIDVIPPGGSKTFEPRESLRLSYSKSLTGSARLFLNGKRIELPATPANPKRAAIEIEINAANIGKIWELGRYEFEIAATATPAAQLTPKPAPSADISPDATPTASPSRTNSPRPSASPTKSPERVAPQANANRGVISQPQTRPTPN